MEAESNLYIASRYVHPGTVESDAGWKLLGVFDTAEEADSACDIDLHKHKGYLSADHYFIWRQNIIDGTRLSSTVFNSVNRGASPRSLFIPKPGTICKLIPNWIAEIQLTIAITD